MNPGAGFSSRAAHEAGDHARAAILLLTIIFCNSALISQHIYTLQECIAIARTNSTERMIAERSSRSAQLEYDKIRYSSYPEVKFEGKALYAPNTDHFGYDPAITDGGQYSAQIGIQELLFDGGARSSKTGQAKLGIDRTEAEQRRSDRDLQYDVTLAFFDVLQAMADTGLQAGRVGDLAGYLDLVTRLFHGGGVSYTDVLKTRVNVNNSVVDLLKARVGLAEARITLANAMGNPSDTLFEITGALDSMDGSAGDSLLASVLADSALTIDLRIAEYEMKQALLDVDVARSERLPLISLTGDAGLLTSGDNLRLPSDERIHTLGYSIGISVENLLFNWGTPGLRIQQQELASESSRLNYLRQKRTLVAEAKRLKNAFAGAIGQLRTIRQATRIAEDNYALTKAQYAGGSTTALEVLSAEQLLADNRQAELQARADCHRLFARIEQLTTR